MQLVTRCACITHARLVTQCACICITHARLAMGGCITHVRLVTQCACICITHARLAMGGCITLARERRSNLISNPGFIVDKIISSLFK